DRQVARGAGRRAGPDPGLLPRGDREGRAQLGAIRPTPGRFSRRRIATRKGVAMYFKQILDERCGCASYLIASRQSHEAAIVDPSVQIDQYDELLRERDFSL